MSLRIDPLTSSERDAILAQAMAKLGPREPSAPPVRRPVRYVEPCRAPRFDTSRRAANLAGLARFVRSVRPEDREAAAERLNEWMHRLGEPDCPSWLSGLGAWDLSEARDQLMKEAA